MASLARNTSIVGSLTLLSRIFGFVRDLIVARLFGANDVADAFFVAFRIPNLLRSIFAEGALTSAFVPVMAEQLRDSKERAAEALRSVAFFLLLCSSLTAIVAIFFAQEVVTFFAPGFASVPEKLALCTELTALMLPYIVCVAFIALINGALNTVGVFGASAAAQVLMNITLIAGGLIAGRFAPPAAVRILAFSVLVGGAVQVLAQLPALRRAGLSIIPSFRLFNSVNSAVIKLMIPSILGATLYQIVIFFNTMLASLLIPGAVSWLFYADRLTQLPLGVFTIALSSVLLPSLSKAVASDNKVEFSKHLVDSLRFTSFIIIPLAALLVICAQSLVATLFQRGAFDATDSIMTAHAVQALSLGLWSTSAYSLINKAFFAHKDTVTPTIIGVMSLLISIFASLLLMGTPAHIPTAGFEHFIFQLQLQLRAIFPSGEYGHVGLSYASALASTGSFLISLPFLYRVAPTINWRPFLRSTLTACTAALVAAVLDAYIPGSNSPLLNLTIKGGIGTIAIIVTLFALRSPELFETTHKLRSIAARRSR